MTLKNNEQMELNSSALHYLNVNKLLRTSFDNIVLLISYPIILSG